MPSSKTYLTYSGWQLQLLPYLEQQSLCTQSDAYLKAHPLGEDSNSFPACGFVMKGVICPSNTRPTTVNYQNAGTIYALSSYLGVSGTTSGYNYAAPADGILYVNSSVQIVSITDGTSNTVAVGERPATGDLSYGWGFSPCGSGAGDGDTLLGAKDTAVASAMGDITTNVGLQTPRIPQGSYTGEIDGAHFWSFHLGGANFVFADGHVAFLSYSSSRVFPAMATRNGGEVFTMP